MGLKFSRRGWLLAIVCLLAGLLVTSCGKPTKASDPRPPARVVGRDFWIQAMDPNQTTNLQTKMFGELSNVGKYRATIKQVELRNVEGNTQLIKVDSSVSPPQEIVVQKGFQIRPTKALILQPEGSYIKLFNLSHPLVEGDQIDVVIEFYGGRIFEIEVPVYPYP